MIVRSMQIHMRSMNTQEDLIQGRQSVEVLPGFGHRRGIFNCSSGIGQLLTFHFIRLEIIFYLL